MIPSQDNKWSRHVRPKNLSQNAWAPHWAIWHTCSRSLSEEDEGRDHPGRQAAPRPGLQPVREARPEGGGDDRVVHVGHSALVK